MSDKLYNLNQLQELAGGSDDFVNSMVETFLEYTPGQLNDMMKSFEGGDLIQLGAIAHKIKPNIDLFAITKIYHEIRLVEEHGKNNINSPELEKSLRQVSDVLKEVFNQLEQR